MSVVAVEAALAVESEELVTLVLTEFVLVDH